MQTIENETASPQKRPPLREIGKAVGRSNVHVYRILKGQSRVWRLKKAAENRPAGPNFGCKSL